MSDILDGILARALNQQTELGARLDSYGDVATYTLAIAGVLMFQRPFVAEHGGALLLLAGFYLLAEAVSVARFRRLVSLHLYSSKTTGYAQGIFVIILFLWGYFAPVFYLMLVVCLLNNTEEILVLLTHKESRSDARGLYWVLKRHHTT